MIHLQSVAPGRGAIQCGKKKKKKKHRFLFSHYNQYHPYGFDKGFNEGLDCKDVGTLGGCQ